MNSCATYGVSLPAASRRPFRHPLDQPPCSGFALYVCRWFAFWQRLPSASPVLGARTLLQTPWPSRDSLGQPGRNAGWGDGENAPLEHPLASLLPWVPSSGIRRPWRGLPPCLAAPGLLAHPAATALPGRAGAFEAAVGKCHRSLLGSGSYRKAARVPVFFPWLKAQLLMELQSVSTGCTWHEPAYVIC